MCLSTSRVLVAVANESNLSFRTVVGSSSSIFCLYASASTSPPFFKFQELDSCGNFFFFFFLSEPFNNFSISIPTCLRRNLRNSANSSMVALFNRSKKRVSEVYQTLFILFILPDLLNSLCWIYYGNISFIIGIDLLLSIVLLFNYGHRTICKSISSGHY